MFSMKLDRDARSRFTVDGFERHDLSLGVVMKEILDSRTPRDYTVDELIAATGWSVPSPSHRENMAKALDYFQKTVPRAILRQPDDAGPFNLTLNGVKIRLLNWMQGIDYGRPIDPRRRVNLGDPLIAFTLPGKQPGSWYAFPSTRQETVAIHGAQTRLHKFKASITFVCMQSAVSDAYVGWFRDLPAQYRHGGAQQLFIWDAKRVLKPA